MIRYAETYEIITQESAEDGDVEESGFIDENCETDFAGMVDLLEGTEPSQSPLGEPSKYVWFTHYGEMDMYTGEYENRSYHPKTERDARYMFKAWRYANQ